MKLHATTLYHVVKRVNDGHWLQYGAAETREEAQRIADAGLAFHLQCCPNDRVEFAIQQVH